MRWQDVSCINVRWKTGSRIGIKAKQMLFRWPAGPQRMEGIGDKSREVALGGYVRGNSLENWW